MAKAASSEGSTEAGGLSPKAAPRIFGNWCWLLAGGLSSSPVGPLHRLLEYPHNMAAPMVGDPRHTMSFMPNLGSPAPPLLRYSIGYTTQHLSTREGATQGLPTARGASYKLPAIGYLTIKKLAKVPGEECLTDGGMSDGWQSSTKRQEHGPCHLPPAAPSH